MATTTYDLLDSVTLSTNTANVTFTGLPTDGSYRDLVIVLTGTMAVGTVGHGDIYFNFDTNANYYVVHAEGNGSSTISRNYNQAKMRFSENNSFSTNTLNTTIIQVMDYAVTNKQKPVLIRTNRSDGLVGVTLGNWNSTSAISRFVLGGDAAYETGTTVYVYGIAS